MKHVSELVTVPLGGDCGLHVFKLSAACYHSGEPEQPVAQSERQGICSENAIAAFEQDRPYTFGVGMPYQYGAITPAAMRQLEGCSAEAQLAAFKRRSQPVSRLEGLAISPELCSSGLLIDRPFDYVRLGCEIDPSMIIRKAGAVDALLTGSSSDLFLTKLSGEPIRTMLTAELDRVSLDREGEIDGLAAFVRGQELPWSEEGGRISVEVHNDHPVFSRALAINDKRLRSGFAIERLRRMCLVKDYFSPIRMLLAELLVADYRAATA